MSKRTAELPEEDSDLLTIKPLGAGNEVGRSCILLQFKGKNIMLDCGIHPGYTGVSALPFFDEVDTAAVDILLVTHFHLDHAAAIPYFLEKTNFKGRVFMTHATKAIFRWMLLDYVKVSNMSIDDLLFDEQDLLRSLDKIEPIDFHQELEIEGVKFTAYNAGHVLGASMFHIEIAGVKILYTGDYSREEDRHLMAAESPGVTPDIMICESTYGVQIHEPRQEREKRFTTLVHDIVTRGGRCLIPAFALGRAQELLLILDEYWEAHPELQNVPIYYASSLAKKCMAVYQTYINMMNARIRKQFAVSNPFVFKHISNLKSVDQFDDIGPCVMMASPGMLQSGLSRELFEQWCTDKRNGTIVAGYCVEGTLAKHILNEPKEIVTMSGVRLPLLSSVHYISFSAHVDYIQNRDFIDLLKPANLVLVHGDVGEMTRLRTALVRHFEECDQVTRLFTPKNCEVIDLRFRGEKLAKMIGTLAIAKPDDGQQIQGMLITKDYKHVLLAPGDLREFTALTTSTIVQRQAVPYHATFSLLHYYLEQMFSGIQQHEGEQGRQLLKVLDIIDVIYNNKSELVLEWMASPVNDMVADSVLALILQIESSPASVKLTTRPHRHGPSHHHVDKKRGLPEEGKKGKLLSVVVKKERDDVKEENYKLEQKCTDPIDEGFLMFLEKLLQKQFGNNNITRDEKSGRFELSVDGSIAYIDEKTLDVECDNLDLKKTINSSIQHMVNALEPVNHK